MTLKVPLIPYTECGNLVTVNDLWSPIPYMECRNLVTVNDLWSPLPYMEQALYGPPTCMIFSGQLWKRSTACPKKFHWSFIEKTSVKQDPKAQVCSNFQMSFLHLCQMNPQQRHLVAKSGTNLGPVDLSSDIPPLVKASSSQEQYYVRSARYLVSIWVRLTFG